MATTNDITGDPIRSKTLSAQGRDNWDRIFNKTKSDLWEHHCKHNGKINVAKGESCNWCGESESD